MERTRSGTFTESSVLTQDGWDVNDEQAAMLEVSSSPVYLHLCTTTVA